MDFSHLSQQDQLKDTFSHAFRVKHIASPLSGSEAGDAKTIDCDALLQAAILRLKDEMNILVLHEGNTCGIITRDDLEVLETMSNQTVVALENAWLYETVKTNYFGTIQSLVNALEASDRYTKGHSERVRFLGFELAKEWGAGAMQLGWMNSSLGIGMIVGGFMLGVWGGFKTKIHTTLLGLVVLGLATIAMGAVPPSALYGIAAIFVVGVAVPIANGPIQAVLQATVAPEIQGRIFTLYGSLAGLSAPVGLVLAVPVAEGLGIRMTYWCSGLLCCLLALGAWFVPALLSIEQRPDSGSEKSDAVNGIGAGL